MTVTLSGQGLLLQYKAAGGIWYVTGDDLPLGQLDTRYVMPFNVRAYGAVGDGSANDQPAITAAIAACPAGGTVYFPHGVYRVQSTVLVNKQVNIIGEGGEGFSEIYASGAVTGSVLSISPSGLTKEMTIRDIYVDAENVPTADGIVLNNLDSPILSGIKIRGGLNSLHIQAVTSGRYYALLIFNPAQFGILGDTGSSSTNKFFNCYIHQTTGATTSMTGGVEIISGVDWQFFGLTVERASPLSFYNSHGIRANFPSLSAAGGYIYLSDCEFDSITSGTSDDINCAAVQLINCSMARISGCWISAYPAADGTYNRPVVIDGSKDVTINDCYINGRGGIWFYNSPDEIQIHDNKFPNNGTGHIFNMGTATVTNLNVHGNRYAACDLADSMVTLLAAMPSAGTGNDPACHPDQRRVGVTGPDPEESQQQQEEVPPGSQRCYRDLPDHGGQRHHPGPGGHRRGRRRHRTGHEHDPVRHRLSGGRGDRAGRFGVPAH